MSGGDEASNYHTLLAGGLRAAHTHRTRTQSSMQAASLYLGVRILAGAAGEPCYMASAERPPPGALTWTANSRWGVGGAGYHQQQRGVRAASPYIASRRFSTPRCRGEGPREPGCPGLRLRLGVLATAAVAVAPPPPVRMRIRMEIENQNEIGGQIGFFSILFFKKRRKQ